MLTRALLAQQAETKEISRRQSTDNSRVKKIFENQSRLRDLDFFKYLSLFQKQVMLFASSRVICFFKCHIFLSFFFYNEGVFFGGL